MSTVDFIFKDFKSKRGENVIFQPSEVDLLVGLVLLYWIKYGRMPSWTQLIQMWKDYPA